LIILKSAGNRTIWSACCNYGIPTDSYFKSEIVGKTSVLSMFSKNTLYDKGTD